jgi:tetratricopeptide (TPR) repeat protein
MEIDEKLRLLQEIQQHMEATDWVQALQSIEKLVAVESDYITKATWYYRAGWICDEHLGQRDAAVDHCDAALDCYFARADALPEEQLETALKPLQAIERILFETSNWKKLERAYRKMIVRSRTPTSKFSKLHAALYDKLGAVYLGRLDSKDSARAALEEARRLDPNNEVATPGIDRNALLQQNSN